MERMNLVRRLRFVALLALVAIGLVATTAAPVGATTIYADDQGRFAIGIPDGWVQTTPSSGQLAAWAADGGAALFTIVREDIPAGTSSVDYAQSNVDGVSTFNGYKELDRRFVTCADQQCPLLDYLVTDKSGELQRIQQVFVTKGSSGWVLTYRTFADYAGDYKSDVELMVYSFTI
jgi:hypothetical protein